MPMPSDHGGHSSDTSPQGDHAAVHGMLMIGESRLLMSHLPMFHSPHDYQILLEVSLTAPGSDPLKTYLDDRKASKSKVYTWVPTPFHLSALVADRSAHPIMVGTIFRGHFERGGIPITANDVVARVERVFYAGRLDPKAQPLTELRYLMFGSSAEPFLAHLITRPPDFDQILAAEIKASPPGWLGAWDGGILALRIEGRSPGEALREGEQVQAARLDDPAAEAFAIAMPIEYYLETGDLAS
jgi:hypothetical protein